MRAYAGILLLTFIALSILLAFDAASERSYSVSEGVGEAWYMTPAPLYDFEEGYMAGYTDAKHGESYGGDN